MGLSKESADNLKTWRAFKLPPCCESCLMSYQLLEEGGAHFEQHAHIERGAGGIEIVLLARMERGTVEQMRCAERIWKERGDAGTTHVDA